MKCAWCNGEITKPISLVLGGKTKEQESKEAVYCSTHCMVSHICIGVFKEKGISYDYFGFEFKRTIFYRRRCKVGLLIRGTMREYTLVRNKKDIKELTD